MFLRVMQSILCNYLTNDNAQQIIKRHVKHFGEHVATFYAICINSSCEYTLKSVMDLIIL